MDVSEDRGKLIIWNKLIPSCFLMIMTFFRSLRFYEIKGLTYSDGWGAVEEYPLVFLAGFALFLVATWPEIKYKGLALLLQIIPIVMFLICELVYMKSAGFFRLKWITYGFWVYLVMSAILIVYLCICWKRNRKVK